MNRHVKEILMILLGNLLLAFGVYYFILPNNILSGGVAGIAVALQPLLHVDSQLMVNILVFGLFVFGAVFLGKSFVIKTTLSSVLYPVFLFLMQFQKLIVPEQVDPLMAALFGGLITGVGVGLVLRTGSSTGGMDIPPLVLAKYTRQKLSNWIIVFDGLTVLLGLWSYSINSILIGFIAIWVCSQAVDRLMVLGGEEAKTLFIISDHYQAISDMIHSQLDRGTTIIEASGGFTGDRKPLILTAITRSQYPDLERDIHQIDPAAFLIVSDATEVHGEGFNSKVRV